MIVIETANEGFPGSSSRGTARALPHEASDPDTKTDRATGSASGRAGA